jgi:putative ABC transport system permease protein
MMFKNYLKIAFRNLKKHRGYSFINIVGLAIGMAACLLLFLWIQNELSYDRYHKKAERIYRITSQWESEGQLERFAKTSAPLGPALVNEFPDIEKAVRFGTNRFLISYESKRFYEDVFFADPEVFDIFTFPLIKGDPKAVLKEPRSIIISEEIKEKYFGEEDPIGKIINLDALKDFKITGVFKNIPPNSHFRFDFLGCFSDYAAHDFDKWGISNYWTYVLTSKNFNQDKFKEKLPEFVERYRGKDVRDKYKLTYPLQPLTSIHLHSDLRGEIEPYSDIETIYIFSAVALFILLIACLNYINLSTARYSGRAREVGLRKVVGASRRQLINQFLGESLLFSFIAAVLAVALAELFLPLFNSLSGKRLTFDYLDNLILLYGLVVTIFSVGLAAGSFPALYLSALQPARALKGTLKASSRVPLLRKSLVLSQFAISIIFIFCTITVSNQLSYIRNKKLGFNKEHVVNIPVYDKDALQRYETIKNEFLKNPRILGVSASSFFPGKIPWYQSYWYEGLSGNSYPAIRWISVDHDFLLTFGIELVSGRNFSRDFPNDVKGAYILNESAVKEIGWDSPLGKQFRIIEKGTVVGVVKDFHFKSLHQEIEPLALYLCPEYFEYFSVRISPEGIPQALDFLRDRWQELVPNQLFQFSFLDQDFDNLYKAEMRLQKIFGIVTSLAIFIACLGLFGLAAFTAEQRTKEIGVRKVLGASVSGIFILLSKEFTRWVLVANVIAWPVAYYAMSRWLQNFAYRTSIGLWIFLLAAAVAFVVALLTVSYQAIKAAISNPADALRYE